MDRPAYVPKDFAGHCKVFPRPTASGKDPLLLPYQTKWVLDRSIMKLMEKSRRVGISWSTAYGMVRDHAAEDCREDSWCSSRDEITARLVIKDCKAFAKILQVGARDLGMQVLDDKGTTKQDLAFASDTFIHSVAGNPDVFAGKGGNVLLDELALRLDPRGVYSIAAPTIDWGGGLSVISTHRGTANFFNEIVTEARQKGNPKGWSLHRVTLQDALDQGFLYKVQSKLRAGDRRLELDEAAYFDYQKNRCADEETFFQEYCCVPGDDNAAFLSYDLIAGCEYKQSENWERIVGELAEGTMPLYIGVDIGRDHDLTVIWVIEKVADMAFTRRIVTCDRETFDSQEAKLYELLALNQVRRCCIDQTGIGRQFTERAQKRFGTYKVEGIHFTGPVKEELAYPVRAAFEDKTVRIPEDKFIRADLRGIKKETTASGNIRFSGERGPNGHCDRFWALALALHAGKSNDTAGHIIVGNRGSGRMADKRKREVTA